MHGDTEQTIRDFIGKNYLFGKDLASLKDSDLLLDAGLIDSTGILELVGFLESEFNIKIHDAEIVPENLDSITAITSYVSAKKTNANAQQMEKPYSIAD